MTTADMLKQLCVKDIILFKGFWSWVEINNNRVLIKSKI